MTSLLPPAWLSRALVLISLAFISSAFVIADAPYLHDFAEWLYQSQILKNLLVRPEAVPGFAVIPYPVPNSLATALMAALGLLMPGLWAGKVFLIALLVAWYLVIRLFVRTHVEQSLRDATTLILFGTAALATFFWYGFVSYQLGLLLFTWFLALDSARVKPTTIALFSVAIFFAHAMVFLVFAAYVGLRILLQRKLRYALALAPSGVLSIWFLAGRQITDFKPPIADAQWSGIGETLLYKFGYPAMLGPFKNFLEPAGSSVFEHQPWLYWLGFLGNFLVVLLLGIFVLVTLWKYRPNILTHRAGEDTVHKALIYTVFLLGLLYLVAPYNFFGLFNPGGRLILPMLIMCFITGKQDLGWLTRLTYWPIALFTLLTCGSYFYLVMQTRGTDIAAINTPPSADLPAYSVFDYNEALYASTRYSYFNYRIFDFANQFERIASDKYDVLPFGHGLITRSPPVD